MSTQTELEIAAVAARGVVEDGLEYGLAKRRALKDLGLSVRTPLPSNEAVEDAVREHLAIFCADTQPQELRALRELALVWMLRLAVFRPHLGGAVWRGTATGQSDIYLQLFCDDAKAAEIWLLNEKLRYDVGSVTGFHGETVDALSLTVSCPALGQRVLIHLLVYDHDDVRGALKPDRRGRSWRGDAQALRRLIEKEES